MTNTCLRLFSLKLIFHNNVHIRSQKQKQQFFSTKSLSHTFITRRHKVKHTCTCTGKQQRLLSPRRQRSRLSDKNNKQHVTITWNIEKTPFTETSHWDVLLFPLSRYMPLGLPIISPAIEGSHAHCGPR